MAYPNSAAVASRRAVGAAARFRRSTSPTADSPPTGNHTDGVTVADLIARLTGDIPADLQQHARPEPGPGKPELTAGRTISTRRRYPRRRPTHPSFPTWRAVAATDRPADDTEVIPVVLRRDLAVPPGQAACAPDCRRRSRREPTPNRPDRHRRVMLAGRSLAALFAVLALALTGGAWQWQSAKNNMLNRVSALDPESRDIVDPTHSSATRTS